MAVKVYKPTTPGRRKSSVQSFSDITKKTPEKSLTKRLKSHAGRNNTGKITIRHRGGGVKRLYRMIDFNRFEYDIPAEVISIEYDPNRGARVALVQIEGGDKAYFLAADGMKVGDKLVSSQNKIEASLGNRMPLKYVPVGLFVYNIEMSPGKGGQIVRGAGVGAQLQVVDNGFAQLKLPSSEVRLVSENCLATVGKVSNPDYQLVRWGKAGRMRMKGWRPIVKGKNMNPVDHPHGGGEGHSPIGLKGGPKTPWGKKALGVKTRKKNKPSNKMILRRRKKKKK